MDSSPPLIRDPVTQAQAKIGHLADEVRRLSLLDLAPASYSHELLRHVLDALVAPAGAVWLRNEEGSLRQQCQIPSEIGLSVADPEARRAREELLLEAERRAAPVLHLPQNESSDPAPGLAGHATLIAPVVLGGRVEALLEVWQAPQRSPQALPGMLQFLVRMADLAAVYLARRQEPITTDTELWARLEAFARRIHGSLRLTEVAYRIANEGRQLLGCDRLSVAVRKGRRVTVEAVSGAEAVEQRSNLVRRMRRLCDRVLDWGERLVYVGTPDSTLPPEVLNELDTYVEESHCKLLLLLPLRDEREKEQTGPPRSALVVECFGAVVPAEQLAGRLDVLARHTAPALYNAALYRDVPLRLFWRPIAAIQAGLGGKTRATLTVVTVLVVALLAALLFVPYPLKMDARGQLLPEDRRWVYSPVEGQVIRFEEGARPGARVVKDQPLMLMHDLQLEARVRQLTQEVAAAQQEMDALTRQLNAATNESDRLRLGADRKQKEALRDRQFAELRALRERTNADESRPGNFWLKAPIDGIVLNWDFREALLNRQVRPSEPLLRIGDNSRRWEVQLRIPQKHMGQIVQAFRASPELDIDLLVLSAPTRTFKGKLLRTRLAGEANPNRESPTDAEPVVLASVRIDGPDIPPEERIPPELFVAGTEVHAKVRCGNHALGYSLFYGVWEFFYERVVFFF
jgi:HlyD family secretion protein